MNMFLGCRFQPPTQRMAILLDSQISVHGLPFTTSLSKPLQVALLLPPQPALHLQLRVFVSPPRGHFPQHRGQLQGCQGGGMSHHCRKQP